MPFENNENPIDINSMPKNSTIKQVENMIYLPSIYKSIGANGKIEYSDANNKIYTIDEINEICTKLKLLF